MFLIFFNSLFCFHIVTCFPQAVQAFLAKSMEILREISISAGFYVIFTKIFVFLNVFNVFCWKHVFTKQNHWISVRNRLAEGIHKLLMIVGEKCAEVVGALWINLGDQALWPSPWGLLYIPSFRVLPGPHGCPWRPQPPHPPPKASPHTSKELILMPTVQVVPFAAPGVSRQPPVPGLHSSPPPRNPSA